MSVRVAVVAPYLNEAQLLPLFLSSLAAQERVPDELVLVDDGSTDGSGEMAAAFAAEHRWARALARPPRLKERDRLASAAELKAFQWGVEQLSQQPDVVIKLDSDLRLPPQFIVAVIRELEADPKLGITGAYLSQPAAQGGEEPDEDHSVEHVRGATKCYRWTCWVELQPLPAVLGRDTIDETKAHLLGWRTRSIHIPGAAPLHMRPTGTYDGRLRAYRRWGHCAWGFGAHPLYVLAGGLTRSRRRPYVLTGLNYVGGWAWAALRWMPRADRDVRRQRRREELQSVRARLLARG